jgi:hypothetical protein
MTQNAVIKSGLAALETKAAAERGGELQLLNSANEPTDIYIKVIGADSEEFRRAERRIIDKATQEMVKRRRFNKSSAQVEQEEIELLVLATRGWRTGASPVIHDLEGKPLEYSDENVRRVYAEFPLVREQVAEFIRDRANFLPR